MSSEAKEMFTFTWTIDSAQLLILKSGRAIESPSVDDDIVQGAKWSLKMCRRSPQSDHINIDLWKYDSNECEKDISASLRLEVVNSDGTAYTISEESHTFSKNSSSYVEFAISDMNFFSYIRNRMEKINAKDKLMIRCHLTYDQQHNAIQTQMCSFKWNINIPQLSSFSEKITVPYQENTHFDVILSESSERIYIKVENLDFQSYGLEITVLNCREVEIGIKDPKYVFEPTQRFETWIEKWQVAAFSSSNLAYSFSLLCAISAYSGTTENESGSLGYPIVEDVLNAMTSQLSLQQDLKNVLLSENHADVKLRVCDQLLPAHKCLLSARSPVFSTMFDQDMLETQTGIVDIPDVESETLQSFLEFLYTDSITNTDYDKVLKLMLLADKYQVDGLKKRCSLTLITKLSKENVCQIVSVADMFNQPNLKLFAMRFIKANKKDIMSSPDWSEWMEKNTKLANEILAKIIVD